MKTAAVVVLGGVVGQAVLGGFTVLLGLHPATVAAHFLVSMGLVVASSYLWFARNESAPAPVAARATARRPAGVGDRARVGAARAGARHGRHRLRPPLRRRRRARAVRPRRPHRLVAARRRRHAVPRARRRDVARRAAHRRRRGARARRGPGWSCWASRWPRALIGYVQYFTDLPEALVVAHMLGASLLVVALTHGVLALRRRADAEPSRARRSSRAQSSSRPAARASATASPRDAAPSLARMFETCTLAVFVLMNRARPISPLERPSASRAEHLLLAGVSAERRAVLPRGEVVERARAAARRRAARAVSRAAPRARRRPRGHPRRRAPRPAGSGRVPPRRARRTPRRGDDPTRGVEEHLERHVLARGPVGPLLLRGHPGLPRPALDRRGQEERAARADRPTRPRPRRPGGRRGRGARPDGRGWPPRSGGAEVSDGQGGEAHLGGDAPVAPEAAQEPHHLGVQGQHRVDVAVAAEHVDRRRAGLHRDPALLGPPGRVPARSSSADTPPRPARTPSAAASMLAAAHDGIPTSVVWSASAQRVVPVAHLVGGRHGHRAGVDTEDRPLEAGAPGLGERALEAARAAAWSPWR